MNFKTVKNALLREEYSVCTHESGLKIIYIPKHTPLTHAVLCVGFGAQDISYKKGGEVYSLPPGTAHFLEHKMFENADGSDSFLAFDALGANANAFTSQLKTNYYFSCGDNFYQSLAVLLEAVSGAHFTAASVARERAIIKNEINMYSDDPEDEAYHALMRLLYCYHPIRNKTGGTARDVDGIGVRTLKRAFGDFYLPSNMALAVCGSADIEKIYKEVDRVFGGRKYEPRPETLFQPEPGGVAGKYFRAEGAVAKPLFEFGIKCRAPLKLDLAAERYDTALHLAMSLAFGPSSDFYCRNYADGTISDRFFYDNLYYSGGAHLSFGGSADDPEKVAGLIRREICLRRDSGFEERDFLRAKKAEYAACLFTCDSCAGLASEFAECSLYGYDLFDTIALLREITFEEVNRAFDGIDTENASALSVIIPEKTI